MHMSEAKKLNPLGIIGIVGALLMIIGVFLSWIDFSVSSSLFGASETYSASGLDIFGNGIEIPGIDQSIGYDTITAYTYAPIVALVCGIIALIATIIPTVYNKGKVGKGLGALALILAIVSVVISFLFYSDVGAYEFTGGLSGILSMSLSVGAGLWVCIAGAIITIIGGIIDVAKKGA